MASAGRVRVVRTIQWFAVIAWIGCCGCGHRQPAISSPEAVSKATRETVSSIRLRAHPVADSGPRVAPAGATLPAGGGLPGADTRVNQDVSLRFQNEPVVAVDPSDPQHIVAAWCDNYLFDRNWTLQLTDLAHGWSFDGGTTWDSRIVDFGNIPAGALTADPSLAFDSVGNVFLTVLQYDPYDRFNPDKNKVFVAKSIDGGASYGDGAFIDAGGVDKPWVATHGTTVHVVWTNEGDVFFSKSLDGGQTYSVPQLVAAGPVSYNAPVPVVGAGGELYVIFNRIGDHIYFRRSLNGGQTWGLFNIPIDAHVEPRNPLAGGFRNPAIPTLAIDHSGGAHDGRLYAVWPDGRFGDPDILLSVSTNGGASWGSAIRVNDDAIGNDADQFFPWAAVDGAGHLHVAFLDRREDPAGLEISYYMATSTDGGASFGPNIRLSDGGSPPAEVFFGDYTGLATSGSSVYPFWPDARTFNQNVFFHPVDSTDFDDDGRLNDGDADGQYGGNGCTGGQTTGCDDNCPGTSNSAQLDSDGDRVGDACDNCPLTPNLDQYDLDRDGDGNACDSCPSVAGAAAGDPDGDLVDGCIDNCPQTSNGGQADGDGDGIGDACDVCPLSALNDDDGDGICGDVDSCPLAYNPLQVDTDGDGDGNICDNCVVSSNASQVDADFDDQGDACDCDSTDFTKRRPRSLRRIDLAKTDTGAKLIWTHTTAAETYSVSRGLLDTLGPGSYGTCLAEPVDRGGHDDDQLPAPDQAFFYLVQGYDTSCGLGSSGFGSDELPRVNGNAGACTGAP